MTVGELISKVDELKPNHYSEQRKLEWLNHLEEQIYFNIILQHEGHEDIEYKEYESVEQNGNDALLASGMYEDLYRYYIESQIDYANQEINKYNNSSQMHNAFYEGFEKWYRRNHMPIHKVNSAKFYKGG